LLVFTIILSGSWTLLWYKFIWLAKINILKTRPK
jgi:hypothetical protein